MAFNLLFCYFHSLNATKLQETGPWTLDRLVVCRVSCCKAGSPQSTWQYRQASHLLKPRNITPGCIHHFTMLNRSVKQGNNSYALHCIRRNTERPVRSRWDSFSRTFRISPDLNVIFPVLPTPALWVRNAAEATFDSVHCIFSQYFEIVQITHKPLTLQFCSQKDFGTNWTGKWVLMSRGEVGRFSAMSIPVRRLEID